MVYSVVDHKVEDYAKWKPAFDKHKATIKRLAAKAELFIVFLEKQITFAS
jgi:hypothetical protein